MGQDALHRDRLLLWRRTIRLRFKQKQSNRDRNQDHHEISLKYFDLSYRPLDMPSGYKIGKSHVIESRGHIEHQAHRLWAFQGCSQDLGKR